MRRGSFALMLVVVLAAGARRGNGQAPAEDYTKVDPQRLGIKPVPAQKDAKTGFVVGGKNATAALRKLTELAGRRIADLEKDMRPRAVSWSGFLGTEEKLLDVLAADNAYVVDELGLTHQELARPLRILGAVAVKQASNVEKGKEFACTYQGRKYKVKADCFRGYQKSPFKDGTRTNCNATVWNLQNGKRLEYSLLVPEMMARYGFYEGLGTPYRVDPRAVLEVFDFLKPGKAR